MAGCIEDIWVGVPKDRLAESKTMAYHPQVSKKSYKNSARTPQRVLFCWFHVPKNIKNHQNKTLWVVLVHSLVDHCLEMPRWGVKFHPTGAVCSSDPWKY